MGIGERIEMLRLAREYKPYTIGIIFIIILLFIQAVTELALPEYMSNIVNIGIEQNGIQNTVPVVIKREDMDRIKLFIDKETRELVEDNYKLIDKNDLNREEYEKLLKEYPIINTEDLYILNTKSKKVINNMEKPFARAIFILDNLEKELDNKTLSKYIDKINPNISQNGDMYFHISQFSQEELDRLNTEIDEDLGMDKFPENMINQRAINYIKNKYDDMAISIIKIQSNYILYVGGIMLLISLLTMMASVGIGYISAKISAGVGKNLRKKVFEKISTFSNTEFDKYSTASLITRNTNDIQQIQTITIMLLRVIFFAPILGVGGVIKALNTNVSMAWIIMLGVIVVLGLISIIFSIAIPRYAKIQNLVDKLNRILRESLGGILIIRAFNTQKIEEDKFESVNQELTKTNLFVLRIMNLMRPGMMLIMDLITVLVIWVAAHEINDGNMQVGDMMAYTQYTRRVLRSFLMISMISTMLPRASVSANRIVEILDTETSIKDPENPKELKKSGLITLEFKNVSFKYPGANEAVLKNISFKARSGEIIAFIGSTGSGKSTLVNLIPRLYDVTEGEILLNNINIKDLRLRDLRENIGYIPQKAVLFTGTIESNIRYGKNENINDEDIYKALEIAQGMEIVNEKKEGLSYQISQGGTNVSGGQRQRLTIARALAKKSDILIFDDSLSALDFKTDALLRKAISREINDSIVLIVGQRISSIMNAHKIIVLDEGEIVGMGTHRELLKDCNIYRQIAASQLSEEELLYE